MATLLLIVLIAWFVLTLASIAYDNAWAASFTFIGAGVIVTLFYGIGASFLWLTTSFPLSWFGTITVLITYVVVGILWSFFKFYRHVKKNKVAYKERGLQEIDKKTIGMWIAYWPFSLIVYILGDLFRELMNGIVNKLQGIYKRIMDKALGS